MPLSFPKILVSACLLGENVRYHGGDARLSHPTLDRWLAEGRIVRICPEVDGGLPAPRPPSEIQGGDGAAVLRAVAFVRTGSGSDVTASFLRGAAQAVEVAREHGARVAVLKDGSPSCGSTQTYDGTFTGHRVSGGGVTAAALREAGVRVFSERELEQADALLSSSEARRGRTE
jgi:uncharacterized protein YbbK (DUF523 family)